MSKDVLEQLVDAKPSLAALLEQNYDIANALMGLLGRLLVMCIEGGHPIAGISFGGLHGERGEFKSNITFSSIGTAAPALFVNTYDFRKFMAHKSARMAQALDKNPKISRFFEDLAEACRKYAVSQLIPYVDLKVQKAIITKENLFYLKVGKEAIDERTVHAGPLEIG